VGERVDHLGPVRRSMCAGILGLQCIALVPLASVLLPVTDLPTWAGLTIGIGLPVLCLLGAATMRGRRGGALGWFAQAATFSAGFATPWLFALGAVFAALYAGCWLLGAKIDRERVERLAEHDRRQRPHGDGAETLG
jgi:hypothetical protein